ncbi:hypothetical protein EPD60_11230 [Flaviaesturariibacter flavus]|uniref:Uncharacterized protein n=1 Tax=Flaviaesturariibacter flavus TaxID=2502780 RepID=A0A4R1BC01_9BACT|nr:hypothetical protein [Flaviaesturariibacter flavus]TCJ14549.1 hypothetical protein EPD60_11230 [Flaviaesturariibacter flavus]
MKRLLVFAALALGIPALAQKKGKSIQPPAAAATAFRKAHPGIKGTWEKEGANYEVNFKERGQTMSSVIDSHGTIIETETEIRVSDLPQSARTYLKEHYANQKIKDAARIQKADGTVAYEAGIGKKDILFDESGKFVKEVKD